MIFARRDVVIFDMDGTLLDSVPVVSGAYAAAIHDLGGPVVTPEEVVAVWHVGHTAVVLGHFLGRECGPGEVERFHTFLDPQLSAIRPFDGITELLGTLRRSGLRLAVFTAATRRSARDMLRAAGLSGHFGAVVAGDEITRPKPAPDGLRLARQRLGITAGRAAYAGHAEVDLGCACNDDSLGIHAAWGAKPGVRTGPHPVAEHPLDVAAIVGSPRRRDAPGHLAELGDRPAGRDDVHRVHEGNRS